MKKENLINPDAERFFDECLREVKTEAQNDENSLIRYLWYSGIFMKYIECKGKALEKTELAKRNKIIKTYLLADKNTGFFKIGRSVDPFFREKTLQSDCPLIEMVCVTEHDIEKQLHDEYEGKRIRGEWFNLSDKDVSDIKKLFKEHNQKVFA